MYVENNQQVQYRRNSPKIIKSNSTFFCMPLSFSSALIKAFNSFVDTLAAMEYGVSGIAYLGESKPFSMCVYGVYEQYDRNYCVCFVIR